MIVSSFASEYGVRIYSDDFGKMTWDEFVSLLSGLSEDSPLGRIVRIRLENDPNMLKQFSAHQKKIRNQWRSRRAKAVSTVDRDTFLNNVLAAFKAMAK